jgi:hypothetical protein
MKNKTLGWLVVGGWCVPAIVGFIAGFAGTEANVLGEFVSMCGSLIGFIASIWAGIRLIRMKPVTKLPVGRPRKFPHEA